MTSAEHPNSVRENVRFPKRRPEPERSGSIGVFGVRVSSKGLPSGFPGREVFGIAERLVRLGQDRLLMPWPAVPRTHHRWRKAGVTPP
jgi:hypothetical protein